MLQTDAAVAAVVDPIWPRREDRSPSWRVTPGTRRTTGQRKSSSEHRTNRVIATNNMYLRDLWYRFGFPVTRVFED